MINNTAISLTGGAVTGEVGIGRSFVYLDAEKNLPIVRTVPRGSYLVKKE